MKHMPFLSAAFILLVTVALIAPRTIQACTIDGKATAFADGSRAVLSQLKLTVATAHTWAPFSFRGHYHARASIRFSEDRAQLGRVLPFDSLHRAWRWEFGDGTRAVDGWTVAHRYLHPGAYRITVAAYSSSWKQYFPFDTVRIVVTK